MLGRKLACSFCGKKEDDVTKLVAGPNVYICDQCAAEVIRIMEASTNDGAGLSHSRGGLLHAIRVRILGLWHRSARRSIEHCAVARPITDAVYQGMHQSARP